MEAGNSSLSHHVCQKWGPSVPKPHKILSSNSHQPPVVKGDGGCSPTFEGLTGSLSLICVKDTVPISGLKPSYTISREAQEGLAHSISGR